VSWSAWKKCCVYWDPTTIARRVRCYVQFGTRSGNRRNRTTHRLIFSSPPAANDCVRGPGGPFEENLPVRFIAVSTACWWERLDKQGGASIPALVDRSQREKSERIRKRQSFDYSFSVEIRSSSHSRESQDVRVRPFRTAKESLQLRQSSPIRSFVHSFSLPQIELLPRRRQWRCGDNNSQQHHHMDWTGGGDDGSSPAARPSSSWGPPLSLPSSFATAGYYSGLSTTLATRTA
jgi:hypothetical protein